MLPLTCWGGVLGGTNDLTCRIQGEAHCSVCVCTEIGFLVIFLTFHISRHGFSVTFQSLIMIEVIEKKIHKYTKFQIVSEWI